MWMGCCTLLFLLLAPRHATPQVRILLNRLQLPRNGSELNAVVRRPQFQEHRDMNNFRNVYYYSEVELGTPGQPLRVVFDTGSPSLWVYSGSFKAWNCFPCWIHRKYFHFLSRSYREDGRPVTINYVGSYIQGFISRDILTVGEISVNVTFAEATSGPFWSSVNEMFDGILGLAPCAGPSCRYYREEPDPVVADILQRTASDTFAVYLDRSGSGQSEIVFGGTNKSLYIEKTLVMHPTPADYIWTVRLDSIWVGHQKVLDYRGNPPVEAYIDTGTSLIVGPPWDVNRILNALGIPHGLEMPCSQIKYLQNISFVIGGRAYIVQPEDYASVNDKTVVGKPMCYHGLEGMEVGGHSWVLGDNFMGAFYTVFRMRGRKAAGIGFAQLRRRTGPMVRDSDATSTPHPATTPRYTSTSAGIPQN